MENKYIVFDLETTGLTPAFDSIITCICAKDSDGNIFIDTLANKTETQLINAFLEWLGESIKTHPLMVTCNGIDFDIPFILLRCMKLGIYPVKIFDDFKQFDIQGTTYKKISLSDMGILLKCNFVKKTCGIDAIRLYQEESFRDLIKYCMNDVNLTEEIYLKLI
jgi:DNA polymerase III epsilon subunit-like protein